MPQKVVFVPNQCNFTSNKSLKRHNMGQCQGSSVQGSLKLHEYIVMPNHFHAIVEIVGATLVVAQNNNDVVTQ